MIEDDMSAPFDDQPDSGAARPAVSEAPDNRPDSPAPRPGRTAIVLAVVLTVTAGFLAAVVFGAVWLSSQWAGPSSDDPTESVDGFLTALFTDRDAEAATGYLCSSMRGDLNPALDLLDSLPESGGNDDMTAFSWDDVTEVTRDDGVAVVTADVTLDITGDTATWTFAVVTGDPDDTWRVCGVEPGQSPGS
jgi:hypothetical protein